MLIRLWFIFWFSRCVFCLDLLVNIPQGAVRGLKAENGDYLTFLGIPYAKVNPANPFGNAFPSPMLGKEVFEANDETRQCPQTTRISKLDTVSKNTLDCLRLNIYVPTTADEKNKMPVMVFIHGGSFKGGSGTGLNAQYIVRHDVVLVTINYRLGPYGFMCMDSKVVPGNSGLKDQVLALNWVQMNIGYFGGNPDNVVLFGEGAGAVSVELHMLSSVSSRLFSKALIHSSSAFAPASLHTQHDSSLEIIAKLGNHTENVENALEKLSKIEPSLVISTSQELGLEFGPCVEKKFNGIKTFMTESPIDLIQSSSLRSKPMIIGHNSDESNAAIVRMKRYDDSYSIYHGALQNVLIFDTEENHKKTSDIVEHFYHSMDDSFITFDSDVNFNYPITRSISLHLNNTVNPIYFYIFGYAGLLNNNAIDGQTKKGATHGDELLYIFTKKGSNLDDGDQKIVDTLTTMWTNFAKFGDPTPESNTIVPILWKPVSKMSFPALWINRTITIVDRPYSQRMAFWELFYETYSGTPKYQFTNRQHFAQYKSCQGLIYWNKLTLILFAVKVFLT